MDVDMVFLSNQQQSIEEDTEKMDFINRLDNKLLEKIFMMLSISERLTMEKVCLKFKEACQLTWQSIKKFKCSKKLYPWMKQSDIIEILKRCGNYLEELYILYGVCDSSIIMPFVGNYCKNLTTLEFCYDENIKTNKTKDYTKAFKQLNTLECIHIIVLRNNRRKKSRFPSKIINSLPGELLIKIHVSCERLTDSVKSYKMEMVPINFNLDKFKKLRSLSLEYCYIPNSMIEKITNQTQLTYLFIKKSFFEEKLLTFNKLSNLKYIRIWCYYQKMDEKYTSSTLNCIIKTCKEMNHLSIGSYIGSCNLREIALCDWMNFQNLETLNIAVDSIEDLSIKLVECCKKLERLYVSVTCEKTITENALKNLSQLKELKDFRLFMMEISVESIIYISNNFKKLKILFLPKFTGVQSTDGSPHSSASVLDVLSNLQHLVYLYLLDGEQLQDSTIIAIANKCKNLRILIMKNCPKITETSLDALAELKNLKTLEITGNTNMTDKSTHKFNGLQILKQERCIVLNGSVVNKCMTAWVPPTEWYKVFGINKTTPDGRIKAIDIKQDTQSYEVPFFKPQKRRKIETSLVKKILTKFVKT